MTFQTQTHALLILIAAILTNNILLTNFLGMCSFIACSGQIRTSFGLGAAVTFVLVCTAVLNYIIYYGLLIPCGLTHLQFIIFITIIAAFTQFVEMVVERVSFSLYYALGIFLPLITVNCAIMGTSLFMVIREYTFSQAVGYALGSGVGWWLAILLMAGMRKRMLLTSRVPRPLEGVGIILIATCIMAMAFMGFAGMVNIQ